MKKRFYLFGNLPFRKELLTWQDLLIFLFFCFIVAVAVTIGKNAPASVEGPAIALSPAYLPRYALFSTLRMLAAYILSLIFMVVYGYLAARSKWNEKILIPLLDVLQSMPMLSFLPLALITFTRIFPLKIAVELSTIVIIFTCQVWNLTFSWYQSLITLPPEYKEAAEVFKLNWWLRFKNIELPFASTGIIWNSMLSWAGGWLFLMAAEMFRTGNRDFRLPGLGSYLQQAAATGDVRAIWAGMFTLVLLIVLLDQLVWRPLICWSERFRPGQNEFATHSWFYDLIRGSRLMDFFHRRIMYPVIESFDRFMARRFPYGHEGTKRKENIVFSRLVKGLTISALVCISIYAMMFLAAIPVPQLLDITKATGFSFLRVYTAIFIALLWTVPLGVAIGMNKRLSSFFQPALQLVSSIPASALFPIVLFWFIRHQVTNLNIPAVLLLSFVSQWYLLFNIIAGAQSIPEDLMTTANLMPMSRLDRWRILILPSIFPYLITGLITASGGSWNAAIIAEYVEFGGKTFTVSGLGALIVKATADSNYSLLFAGTTIMIIVVLLINRLVWRRLYQAAENNYRLE